MATITIKVCDQCRQDDPESAVPAPHTRSFHVDQHGYSLDLCEQHDLAFAGLWSQVVAWKELATVISGTSTAPRSHRGGSSADQERRAENAELRQWAVNNGHDIGERGRIPDALREQFRAERAAGLRVESAASNGVGVPMAGLPR